MTKKKGGRDSRYIVERDKKKIIIIKDSEGGRRGRLR